MSLKKVFGIILVITLLGMAFSACGHSGTPNIGNPSVGDTITFGSYEQDNNTANGKEDIEWLVLEVQEDRILVISKYGLDAQPYNSDLIYVTWETCTLRSWLNETFYDTAFSSEEQALISSVTIRNEDNSDYRIRGGNDTTDQVFLLSLNEANTYFRSNYERCCVPTEYAVAQGVFAFNAEVMGYPSEYNVYNGNCVWWLRSPGAASNGAANVFNDGSIFVDGIGVSGGDLAVRPALWINLNS